MNVYCDLALHTLFYNRKQYTSLFVVAMISSAVMLAALSISSGMLNSLNQKAKIYYGGDLQVMCGGKSYPIEESDNIIATIKKYCPSFVEFYKRFDFDASHAALFFQGESVRQRMFKGVDFQSEAELFTTCNFTQGNAAPSLEHNTIVISNPIAKKLGAKVGDFITLEVVTETGYINTVNLIVQGIAEDSSLFGMYTSYVDIVALRSATDYPADYVNRICLYYASSSPSKLATKKLHSALKKEFDMFKLTNDKEEFFREVIIRNAVQMIKDINETAPDFVYTFPLLKKIKSGEVKIPKDLSLSPAVISSLVSVEELTTWLEGFRSWYYNQYGKDYSGMNGTQVANPLYALITLGANTHDLQMLLDAMTIVVLVIIIFLVAIISVGVSSTYRVIVMRRTTEIGIFRAIGMVRSGVRSLFVIEALYLLFASFIVGAVLSFIITTFASGFNLSFIPAFDMFLTRGHLLPTYNIAKSLLLLAIICVTTVLSVLFTVRDIIHISPAGALATTS